VSPELCRSDSEKRTYINTARRITSGEELNRLNGLGGFARDLRGIKHRYRANPTEASPPLV